MSSYAPLLSKKGFTQWTPDLIYFTNSEVNPSVNYYVQKLYGQNSGDVYITSDAVFTGLSKDQGIRVPVSVVKDSKSGDIIIKLVNCLPIAVNTKVALKGAGKINPIAEKTVLTGLPDDLSSLPQTSTCKVDNQFLCDLPANSFTVIRVKTK
jgi:alpha-L-arabinofuranosidase